jgi:hypothetical protein
MKPNVEKWATEAEMFSAFMAEARTLGFCCYPESGGHDLILVAPTGLEAGGLVEGDQIAVEGKLRDNLAVLHQALPPGSLYPARKSQTACDFYAVLVPGAAPEFRDVARALGIRVLQQRPGTAPKPPRGWHPPHQLAHGWEDDMRVGLPRKRLLLEVEMEAGAPSPRAVTPWKIDAVRLCMTVAERGGELRSSDFTGTQVRARTFVERGWMQVVRREGRVTVYQLAEHDGRPDRVYPEVVAALRRTA